MRRLSTTFRRTPLPVLLLSLLLPLALLNACGSSNAATAPIATRSATATATPEPGTFYFTTDDGVTLERQDRRDGNDGHCPLGAGWLSQHVLGATGDPAR